MLAFGLGYGNYGKAIGQVEGAGTHNMFMNALVNAGVLGLLGLVGLIVWGLNCLRGVVPGGRRLAGAFTPFVLLAFLDAVAIGISSLYEFEDLATSAGAMIFWFLLAVGATVAGRRDDHDGITV